MPACCSRSAVTRLRVGDMDVGMTGLEAIFARFINEGRLPDGPETARLLVEAAREAGNYMSAGWEDRYAVALRDAYAAFWRNFLS